MNSGHEVNVTIDNQALKTEKGLTILQVAERNNIYIPTLCAHKDLTPFGGCRMCIVEVDKMRGLPTACTTPVEDGMVIRTRTAQVHAVRQEILQLILSEHTSSCLICDEKEECKLFSTTIRKAGVTTGCRYCPNDQQCELQKVVESLELKEIGYPIYYRNLPVEKDDPFFDRDYNLCILCGRCVRMCQDVRTAGTLAFSQRGPKTVIGPAFQRTHLDAGCEFCGACVSVCPTGALSERARKWEGKPEREEPTTCPLCGVGCQMRLLVKGNAIMGTMPADDPLINDGQLCVKGRFCITELVNGHQRLQKPYQIQNGTKALISWEQAIDLAAAQLSACAPEDFGMLISPNCGNEDLYIAQKFVRVAMKSHHIDNSARIFYGSAYSAYLDLLKSSVPLSDLQKASAVVCLGLDARFGRSVVGVELRKALKRGAKVITIHPRHHSLGTISDCWIRPAPGTEMDIFLSLASLTGKDAASECAGDWGAELRATAGLLKEATAPVLLVGSEFLHYDAGADILKAIAQVAQNTGAGIALLPAHNNLLGTILMGACPEILPGGASSTNHGSSREIGRRWDAAIPEGQPSWNAAGISSSKKLRLLYLVGEVLPNLRSHAEFSIFQNIYPPDPFDDADLVLPAAAFGEAEGTVVNGEGRIQRLAKAVPPPGQALADWQIICRIAGKMGVTGFDFADVAEIQREISSLAPELAVFEDKSRTCHRMSFNGRSSAAATKRGSAKKRNDRFPLVLSVRLNEHTYRGFPLSAWVEGTRKIFAEGVVEISPKDAAEAAIADGENIVLTSDHAEKILPARILEDQPEGVLHAVLQQSEAVNPNPLRVRIRKSDV
ncbi:MAG: molybdopterin-dependent oxidoreductase [Acidobacteriia bacterium]|nr:molybdopterin-dependent oxidoreductase [Terriglobia bacterium]